MILVEWIPFYSFIYICGLDRKEITHFDKE